MVTSLPCHQHQNDGADDGEDDEDDDEVEVGVLQW